MKHIDILAPETLSGAIPLPGALPPAPAVMRILDQFNREEIGNTIEVLVALLDICDAPADPDEPEFRKFAAGDLRNRNDGMPGTPDDGEAIGDELDHAWPEWHARGKRRVTAGGYEMAPPTGLSPSEDDEDDDPAGQYDEDCYSAPGTPHGEGAGCPISDNDHGIDDVRHDADDDMEREQLPGDVPMLKVYSLEPDPATGERTYLGRSNMMSTFRVGRPGERSADSGAIHWQGMDPARLPGTPV